MNKFNEEISHWNEYSYVVINDIQGYVLMIWYKICTWRSTPTDNKCLMIEVFYRSSYERYYPHLL